MNNIEEKRIDINTEQSMPEVEKLVTSLSDFEAQLNGAKDLNDFSIHKFSDTNGEGYFFYNKENQPLFCIPGKESFISILTEFYNSQKTDAEKYAVSIDDQLNLLKIQTLAKTLPASPIIEQTTTEIASNTPDKIPENSDISGNTPLPEKKEENSSGTTVNITEQEKKEGETIIQKTVGEQQDEKTIEKPKDQNIDKPITPNSIPIEDNSDIIASLAVDISKNQPEIDKIQTLATKIKTDLKLMKKEINSWKREDFKDLKVENPKKEFRNQYKTQINERLQKIEDVEHTLDEIRKGIIPEGNQATRLQQLSQELIQLSDDVDTINISIGALSFGKLPNTPQFAYILETKGDARRLQRSIAKNNEKIKNINGELQGAAGERLKQEDFISLKNYLTGVINGTIDPAVQPFTAQQALAYRYLCSLDPTLENIFGGILSRSINSHARGGKGLIMDNGGRGKGLIIDNGQSSIETTNSGGLLGLAKFGLDKTHMNPKQKEFWLGATNLAMTGALVFGGFKFFQNVFRLFSKSGREKLKDGGWAWIAAPFALTFGSQALTGKGPLELLKGLDIPALFGWKKGSALPGAAGERETYVAGLNGAMALFSGQTYGTMASALEKDSNGKMRIKPDHYETLKTSLEQGTPEQKVSAKFLEYMGKDDPDNMVDLALTGMGITWEDLQNNPNENFDKKAGDVIVRLNKLYEYMQGNDKDINPESVALITRYLKGDAPKYSLEELDKMGVFEKRTLTISPEEKERLRGIVEQMEITDLKEKENILNGLYQFYETWPSADSFTREGIKLERTSNRIYLETYGEKTEINLHEKTLPGLNERGTTYNLKFASTKELMNTANLTNRIKGITRGQTTANTTPFGLSLGGVGVPFTDVGGAITFDKSNRYEIWKSSDTMISGKNIDEASPTLAKQKKEFVEGYLNKRWQHKNEVYYTPITNEVFEAVGGAAVVAGAGIATLSNETPDQRAARETREATERANNETQDAAEKARIEAESKARLDELSGVVDTLGIEGMNETQKKELAEAFKEFYTTIGKNSVPPLALSVSEDGKTLNLTSYGKTSSIDFTTMKLVGLDMSFGTYTQNNYKELFNVANLTNQILDATQDKKPLEGDFTMFQKVTPFVPLGITFNNADVLSTQRDLRVASGSDLSSLSEQLKKEANVDLYVNYLNDNWLKNNLSEEEHLNVENMHTTIDSLSLTDEKRKNKIKSDFDQFYITLGNKVQPPLQLEVKGDNTLVLTSYGFAKELDFNAMKMDNLNIVFKKPEELFKVANLTNNIMLVTTDKQHNEDFDPFKSMDHLGIFFNDQEIFSPNFDTRLVSGTGMSSASKEFSNAGNIDLYVKYLNYIWLNQKNGLSSVLIEGVKKEEVSKGLKLFLEGKINDAPGEIKFTEGKMESRGFKTAINLKDFSFLGTMILDKSGKSNEEAYRDLFELTDLINKAKQDATSLKGDSKNPFNVSWRGLAGGDVEFDTSDSVLDHTLLNYGDIKKLNPSFTKSSNIDTLVDKLNERWNAGKSTEE